MLDDLVKASEDPLAQRGLRTESKTLLTRQYSGEVLVVEYATTTMLQDQKADAVKAQIQQLIDRSQSISISTLRIGKRTLISRYLGRMRQETLRSTPEFLRYFRLGKWRQIAKYLVDTNLTKGYQKWDEILRQIVSESDDGKHIEVRDLVQ